VTDYDKQCRKRFGQHFLTDPLVLQKIIAAIDPDFADHFAEIGPGRGNLTRPLLEKMGTAGKLDVIELDRDLVVFLQTIASPNFHIHSADALKFDFGKLIEDRKPLRLVGNLPYNISTPLIFHLLKYAHTISDMHFMLQKEVTDRLAAKPGTGDYGRLSIMVQYHCTVTPLFDVSPESFTPPPRVNSTFVRLIPFKILPYPAINHDHFSRLVKTAFATRRKILKNCLKNVVSAELWKTLHIDSGARPETLSVADYVRISNALNHVEIS
jgi:16S rRNA (adenine1518-N6/adenine1519-N6)-dimethyltransferase